ncbi:MAG: DUF2141 domain-containing protein [Sphingomonadaceae bacterium]|jgi:uncharacterized protein (DUF2141 family)|nr:DUF2141 domain-containing protein [Sphingomonadaceae bacterium]NBU78711.1 DUF2141 domain-containing protein [Sphingomonadaceae bacterium]NCA00827.1 DUF2141 domain-containing protein [Sphingomonadaceae bacterium]
MVVMKRKSIKMVAALALMGVGFASTLAAQTLGPDPSLCDGSAEPTILVRVTGLKSRDGTIRVRTFSGDPSTYFNKKFAQKRLLYPTPNAGSVDICVPVGAAGVYAVDVRHDANNNGDTDRSDGVGASGNPKFSLWTILLGKKPSAQQVQVNVGRGTTIVPITVRYL